SVMTIQLGLNTDEYPPQESNLGLYTCAEEYPY
ncbi:Os06g0280900, partial [Oryza sativa Japonica Group]